jgi:hypothetical protein
MLFWGRHGGLAAPRHSVCGIDVLSQASRCTVNFKATQQVVLKAGPRASAGAISPANPRFLRKNFLRQAGTFVLPPFARWIRAKSGGYRANRLVPADDGSHQSVTNSLLIP